MPKFIFPNEITVASLREAAKEGISIPWLASYLCPSRYRRRLFWNRLAQMKLPYPCSFLEYNKEAAEVLIGVLRLSESVSDSGADAVDA